MELGGCGSEALDGGKLQGGNGVEVAWRKWNRELVRTKEEAVSSRRHVSRHVTGNGSSNVVTCTIRKSRHVFFGL